MTQRSTTFLIVLLVIAALGLQEASACSTAPPQILSVVVGAPDRTFGNFPVTITHKDLKGLEVYWRGGRELVFWPGAGQHTNPTTVVRNATCMTGPEPLRVVGISGHNGECTVEQTVMVTPPDEKPVISNIRFGNGRLRFDYEFPFNYTGSRELRLTILRTPSRARVELSPWCATCVSQKGTAEWEHTSYEGTLLITATACGDPAKRTVVPVQLPRSDNSCRARAEDCSKCVGSPVKTSSGNMRYTDVDPVPSAPFLPLQRTADSRAFARGLLGGRWTSLFDAWLFADSDYVTLGTEDNELHTFRGSGTSWTQILPADASVSTLRKDPASGNWIHTDADGTLARHFTSSGKIARYADIPSGRSMDIVYDANGLPARVNDSWGHTSWIVTTDAAKRVITSIAVDGRPELTWSYSYINVGTTPNEWHLQKVTSPEGTWRTYEYFYDPNLIGAFLGLTKVWDALGNLIESHTYGSEQRSVSSFGPEGDIDSIQYEQPGRVTGETATIVRYKSGKVETHYIRFAGGEVRTVEIVSNGGTGCTTCSQGDAAVVHDAFGNVIRRQNALGYITESEYAFPTASDGTDEDGPRPAASRPARLVKERTHLKPFGCDPETDPARCRRTSDALADEETLATTAATVTTTFVYGDGNWPDKPTEITISGAEPTDSPRTEAFQYHGISGEVVRRASVVRVTETVPGRGDTSGGVTREIAVTLRATTTSFYGDGAAEDRDTPSDALAPAFEPGGSFQSAWLSLPQPISFRKSVDGPRTDVADVMFFVYYPIDSAVPASLRGRLAAIKNAAGQITRFESYDIFGNVTRMVDSNGVATESTFDNIGRLKTTTVKALSGCDTIADPLCATDLTTTRSYFAAGSLQSEQRPAGGVTTYTYDSRSRVRTISRGPSATDLRERVEISYDATTGNKSLERNLAFENAAWVEKRRESFAYDTFGRLTTITHADGTTVAYAYDAGGRVRSIRDENHATPNTLHSYDIAGRLATVAQTLSTAPGGQIVTSYGYNVHGDLTKVTDPNGNVTSYAVDELGQLARQSSPVTGVTTYAYNAAGDLVSTTDANGATTTRSYDILGRITSSVSTRAGTTEQVSWTYDSTGSFGIGRLSSMTDPTGSTTFAYERRGLLRSESKTIAGATYTTRFGYDANANRSSIVYPSGRTVAFTFDFADRPAGATTGTTTLASGAKYLPFGPATEVTFGNGTGKRMTFDARYRPKTNELIASADGRVIASYRYALDAAGNITRIEDLLDASFHRQFGYDDLHRLTTANGLWGSGSFEYDAMGNLLSSTLGSRSTSFTYSGATPKLTAILAGETSRGVTYDPAGNELAVGPSVYQYSPRNHLSRADEISFGYDGRGLRIKTTRPVQIAAFRITPSAVTGGDFSTGDVTLTSPAPAGGAVVALTSDKAAATVPPTVTVPAGQVATTFTIQTQGGSADPVQASITATFNGFARTASLTINPAQLEGLTIAPATVAGGLQAQGTVTLRGSAPAAGLTVNLTSSHSSATVPPQLVVPGGARRATFAISTSAVSATTAVTMTAALGEGARQATLTIVPLGVAGLTFAPEVLYGGSTTTGTVTLSGPAPAGGATVLLASDVAALSVPTSVKVAAESTIATFTATAAPVEDETVAWVSASLNAAAQRAAVTIDAPVLSDFRVTPMTIAGGNAGSAEATLNAPAAAEGALVEVTSGDPEAIPAPGAVIVPGGATTATVSLPTNPVEATKTVVMSATRQGVTRSTTVTVQPGGNASGGSELSTFAITPDRIIGGSAARAAVTLSAPAPAGGAVVEISTHRRNIIATMPSSVTIPAGATITSFEIATESLRGKANRAVEISVSYRGRRLTAVLMVEPGPQASSTPKPAALCASAALPPCLAIATLDVAIQSHTLEERRYSFYSPELSLLAETAVSVSGGPAIAHEYVWFGSEPLAQITSATGEVHWYFNDHLATPILQTDNAARVVWQAEYEPYGTISGMRLGEGKRQPLRFPGQTIEDGTDLHQNVYRWYRPSAGRYTQSDPIGLNGGLNLYAYVGGQPTGQSDPYGLFTIPRDRFYNKCRTLRKGYAQRELDRVRREPRCRNFFKNTCNSDLDKLFNDPLPRVQLVPESKRPSGGAFDTNTPDVIYISMRECKAMEDFSHTLIHELGHYGDYHNNNDSISDADHSDGCRAEIECFGFTRSLNCKDKGFQPYKPPKAWW